MTTVSWDRLFKTCVALRASDILLLAGHPPFLRMADGLRAVAVEPLTGDEIGAMLRELLPPTDGVLDPVYHYSRASYKGQELRVASFGLPSPRFTILMCVPEPPNQAGP